MDKDPRDTRSRRDREVRPLRSSPAVSLRSGACRAHWRGERRQIDRRHRLGREARGVADRKTGSGQRSGSAARLSHPQTIALVLHGPMRSSTARAKTMLSVSMSTGATTTMMPQGRRSSSTGAKSGLREPPASSNVQLEQGKLQVTAFRQVAHNFRIFSISCRAKSEAIEARIGG